MQGMNAMQTRRKWTSEDAKVADLPDNTFLVRVADPQQFQPFVKFMYCGFEWYVVELDDLASAMYIRPCGDRKTARAAIRRAFK